MPVRTAAEYEAALQEIERLWNAPQGTPDGDRLERLVDDVVAYERRHYPITLGERARAFLLNGLDRLRASLRKE